MKVCTEKHGTEKNIYSNLLYLRYIMPENVLSGVCMCMCVDIFVNVKNVHRKIYHCYAEY